MPESTAVLDLASEDAAALSWDELTLLMLKRDSSDHPVDPYDPTDPELPICGGCGTCGCVCADCHTSF